MTAQPSQEVPMSEGRWTIYVCKRCGQVGEEFNMGDDCDPVEQTHAGEWKSVEVVPASRIEELERERDEAYEDSRRSLERVNRLLAGDAKGAAESWDAETDRANAAESNLPGTGRSGEAGGDRPSPQTNHGRAMSEIKASDYGPMTTEVLRLKSRIEELKREQDELNTDLGIARYWRQAAESKLAELKAALALDEQADPHDPTEFAKTIVAGNVKLRSNLAELVAAVEVHEGKAAAITRPRYHKDRDEALYAVKDRVTAQGARASGDSLSKADHGESFR